VKSNFFSFPVFGWILKTSGYLPSDASGKFSSLVIERVEGMTAYLASGGNLFIFPEGTRSRDGKVGQFNKGAFRIAARCNAPIRVLQIKNTDKLFKPGKFLFNTCVRNDISVKLVASIAPDYKSKDFSLSELMHQVRDLFENRSELSG
jgi:1-acyl-sn-glycerol-3-phosphate acyltransferase